MIPEREREALMRLTMCARKECGMCKYQGDCDYDFQCELATKNMNILADALNADRKTEPQMAEDIVESFGFKAESYRQAKAKTEQTERSKK